MSRAATGNWRGEAGRRSDRFDPVRLMLGSVAHTLAVVASFILSLLFFGFGCGMAAWPGETAVCLCWNCPEQLF